MNFKSVMIVFLSLLLCTSLVMGAAGEAAADKEVKCPGKVSVLVEKVTPKTFNEYKLLEKRILPASDVELKVDAAGIVKKIEKAVGNPVQKGDVILQLDTVKFEKELKEAKENVNIWNRKLQARKGWKTRSERAEKQAEEALNGAKTALAKAEANLAAATVTSPIDGVVGSFNANEGDHVSEGYVVGNIVDTRVLKLALTDYAPNVNDGDNVKIKIKEIDAGVLGLVKKETDNAAQIFIKNDDGKILVGMNALCKILVKIHPNSMVLQKEQIFKDEAGAFIYKAEGNRARKVVVKAGAMDFNGNVLIEEGLAEGDLVIVSEVLSEKEGTLKETVTCVQDNKKIKVVQKDDAGKFAVVKEGKKAKASKPAKTAKAEPAVKKQKAKKVKRINNRPEESDTSKVKIGANVSYFKMSDANFENVFGRMISFGFDVSYMFHDRFDLWLQGGFSSKKADLADFPEADLTFKLTPITLDVRYYLVKKPKFDLLAGAGLNYYSFEENQNLGFENIKDNAVGFNFLAGGYYHVSKKFAIQLLFRINMVKKTMDIIDVDNDLNLNGMEMLFGISYKL